VRRIANAFRSTPSAAQPQKQPRDAVLPTHTFLFPTSHNEEKQTPPFMQLTPSAPVAAQLARPDTFSTATWSPAFSSQAITGRLGHSTSLQCTAHQHSQTCCFLGKRKAPPAGAPSNAALEGTKAGLPCKCSLQQYRHSQAGMLKMELHTTHSLKVPHVKSMLVYVLCLL